MSKIMGDINPAEELMRTAQGSKATKKTAPAKTEGKPKRTFRVNLALRQDIGEELRRRADAENRSVNNYIEQLLLDHFEK